MKKGIHILHVEDDDDHAFLFKKALITSADDVCVSRLTDGIEAMEYLFRPDGDPADEKPDLILLDINMPRMNGHELLERIRADAKLKNIPVVILTSSDAEYDRARALQNSADGYVVKPDDYGAMRKLCSSLVEHYRGRRHDTGTTQTQYKQRATPLSFHFPSNLKPVIS